MKKYSWQIVLGLALIVLSALVYFFHFLIFRDPHHIFIYLIGDIAFVFIEVLMVTLVIHSLLAMREKRTRLEKLNMLIGLFFSEVGTDLLKFFSDWDPHIEQIKKDLHVAADWTESEFNNVSKVLRAYSYDIDFPKVDLVFLKGFLVKNHGFLVRLLENPNLLEHESFTEVLRAVFHLTEELEERKKIKQLSEKDNMHITGDIKRVYTLLVSEWLDYMFYLRRQYPYLFSLAMRLNPFDESATVEIQ